MYKNVMFWFTAELLSCHSAGEVLNRDFNNYDLERL